MVLFIVWRNEYWEFIQYFPFYKREAAWYNDKRDNSQFAKKEVHNYVLYVCRVSSGGL